MSPEVILLRDSSLGSSVKILAGFGFNAYSFRVPSGGREYELLWSVPEFERGGGRPSRSGIPLLFPFAGRIAQGQFRYGGRDYRLAPPAAVDDGQGNAIHGFVFNRPWQIVERGEDHATGRFRLSESEPGLLSLWPGDFTLTVRYELRGRRLISELCIENPGTGELPCGLGTHGYFVPPIDSPEELAESVVRVPVGRCWELSGLLPTGKLLSGEKEQRLTTGIRYRDTQYDDVFTDLGFDGEWCTTSITAPSGRSVVVRFDRAFTNCVVFNPPHREAICIEPYTTVPNAFSLLEQGHQPSLLTLSPGKTITSRVEVELMEGAGAGKG